MGKRGRKPGFKKGDRRQRINCDCGTALEPCQSYYCSNQCRDLYLSGRDVTLAEPSKWASYEEVEKFQALVQKRKNNLHVKEFADIRSKIPEDDSPEAEKRLREQLSPSGGY